MEDQRNEVREQRGRRTPSSAPCAGVIYGLGLIGALAWFWQQADGVREHIIGVLKAFVWPALLVYRVFKSLRG